MTGALAALLPAGVAVVEAAGDELYPLDAPLPPLLAGEEGGLGPHAVDSRRRTYHVARALARSAIAELGIPPGPVAPVAPVAPASPRAPGPSWPDGLVGSITHCRGYRAAAVARGSEWAAVGIDAEVVRPLSPGMLERIATAEERAWLAGHDRPEQATIAVFSAKESFYKVWSPLVGTWLGFHDVTVQLDGPSSPGDPTSFHGATSPDDPAPAVRESEKGTEIGSFAVRLTRPAPAGAALKQAGGRFAYWRGMVLTAIALPAGGDGCRPQTGQ